MTRAASQTILVSFAIVALIALARCGNEPRAQQPGPGDFGFHHHLHHDWYSNKFNRIGRSCCNGTTADKPGDCRPTRAYKQGDTWFALVDGEYKPVPDYAIMPDGSNEEPFQASVCANQFSKEIDCFFKKEGGI